MRFLPDGPDVPDELVALQEEGQTIFVCGAGVSRTVGLPLFRGLVEGVYRELGENWDLYPAEREGMRKGGRLEGQYDRVLRCLERRLTSSDPQHSQRMRERIRSAVREILRAPKDADFANHLALLELSRDQETRTRLITTNFDTLFELASTKGRGSPIESHAGPAMPQPKVSGFAGVLHLHGRLANSELRLEETNLVLTSAEFGDAYLRTGWASRYVYDVARTHTVVLVGYQAEDPPMRYLLEALEADRERYPDLQRVYAFAETPAGEAEVTRALWRAKGIEPILYAADDDHSSLYQSIREWKRYADDPTAWRLERLGNILSGPAAAISQERLDECLSLLRHGDASELLSELSPESEWLPLLHSRRVFEGALAHPGAWIAKRINDPDMIRACATLPTFDRPTHRLIDRAVERERENLTPTRLKAWRLLLDAKSRPSYTDFRSSWYLAAKTIRQGQAGHSARHLVAGILRPVLNIKPPLLYEQIKESGPEDLHQLLWIEFRSERHPRPEEILQIWPQNLDQEVALFRVLERTLVDALEESSDAGFLEGADRASRDVPSVAAHPQNAHRGGFYPITRTLADTWQRIAARDSERARMLAFSWNDLPVLLTQRLFLYAVFEPAIFTAKEAALATLRLSDDTFWLSGAQVEIMRLLVGRWGEFGEEERDALEARVAEGMPLHVLAIDVSDSEDKWESIRDSAVFKRFKRISAAGGQLSATTLRLLDQMSMKYPKWQPAPGDRDDFMVWLGEVRHGPEGHPGLLTDIADDALVKEAMRFQRERPFEEGDIWGLFCSADPDRALRALRLEADVGSWEIEAWRSLLWAAAKNGGAELQFEIADAVADMPDASLSELLPSASSWLGTRRDVLMANDRPEGPLFYQLWDRLTDLSLAEHGNAAIGDDDDVLTRAFGEPSGILAWALLDSLIATKPKARSGLGAQLTPRFDRLAEAPGRAGLLARVLLASRLADLDAIDPEWTEAKLAPRFAWDHLEAPALWQAHAGDRIVSPRLFNLLRPAMLEAFERDGLPDHEYEGLIGRLLTIAIWHRLGEAGDYMLSAPEIRRALTVGPPVVRQNATWQLRRHMATDEGRPADKPERWRTVIGPLFGSIWPLDAALRTEETSQYLVLMALECENAFPEAVESIIDFLVPYNLYLISASLKLENKHSMLLGRYPAAFVRLANALIDPAFYPVPYDLGAFLRECLTADPTLARDPAYVRLSGLRRQRGA